MEVSRSQAQLAIAAAGKAASVIKAALKAQDSARILGATTGNTQLQFHDPQFLDQLRGRNDVDWAKTEIPSRRIRRYSQAAVRQLRRCRALGRKRIVTRIQSC